MYVYCARFTLFILLTIYFNLFATAAQLESYASLPLLSQPKLSIDGTKMIAFKPIDGTNHLVLLDLHTRKFKLLMAADPKRFLFNRCSWANHERVICSIRSATELPRLDQKVIITNMVAVNIDGSNMMQLVPERKISAVEKAGGVIGRTETVMAQRNDNIINMLRDDDEHVLIALSREKWGRPTVYKLNIYTNKMDKVHRFNSDVTSWLADNEGYVRIGIGMLGKKPSIKIRGKKEKKFHALNLSDFKINELPVFQGFSDDDKTIYLSTYNGQDKMGIYAFDTDTEKLGELIIGDDDYDVTNLFKTEQSGLIAAVYYGEKLRYRWLNDEWRVKYESFAAAFPGKQSALVSSDKAGKKLIFSVEGEGHAPSYYLFDVAKRSIVSFGGVYKGLANEEVVAAQAVSYSARDGVSIPAYLTLPKDSKGPYPTVILPHGGPIARDTGRFNYWTQFLASRGYAILQPNFRGSSGYGQSYMEAGYREWGQAMQNDIIDGLKWMIDEKITDPDKVCIVGGSYGGYAALVASYQTPEYFKCAVSFAGVSDLKKTVLAARRYIGGQMITAKMAKSVSSWSNFDDISPIANVEKIAIPLLLVHGDEDNRVAVKQSRKLVEKLKSSKSKIDYRYVEQTGGDHFLSLESHRLQYFQLLDEFLGTYLR